MTSKTFAGIERHVVNLARELRADGCIAEIACPYGARQLRAEAAAAGVPLVVAAERCRFGWLAAVIKRIAAEPPDILHVHDGRSAVTAAILSYRLRSAIVRTQHFTQPASAARSGWRGRASRLLHRFINHRLDGYTGVSRCAVDEARQRHELGGLDPLVIPPTVALPDDETWSKAVATRARVNHPVVAFVGRLEEERRLDILVRAVPLVTEQVPDCRFLIVGSGSAESALQQLAARLDVEGAITWTGWLKEPYAALAGAHVYVNTWPWEGFGMAMAEAMALAIPVIGVRSGASTEMIADGITGMLVAPEDEVALARAIVELASDPERVAEMGGAARRRSLAMYGAGRSAKATLDLYRRLQEGALS